MYNNCKIKVYILFRYTSVATNSTRSKLFKNWFYLVFGKKDTSPF